MTKLLKSYLEELKSLALKEGKFIGFSLEFPYKNKGDYYLLPFRNSEKCVVGACKIFSLDMAKKILKYLDGKADYIFIDSETKNFDFSDIGNIASDIVQKSKVLHIKVNDFTALGADLIISNLLKPIKDKKIVIVGAGNIGCKLAIKLGERGASVHLTDPEFEKAKKRAESINNIIIGKSMEIKSFPINELKNFNSADCLVGFTRSYSNSINHEMVKRTKKNVLIIDGGIGTLSSRALKEKRRFVRVDSRIGFYGYIDSVVKMENFLENNLGVRKIKGRRFVAGGEIGKKGDIIIDSVRNPKRIIGVADGLGGLIRSSLGNAKINRKFKEEVLKDRFVFRVDGGSSETWRKRNEQGLGHVSRSLILASELKKKGHKVFFIMKNLPGVEEVEKLGFKVFLLKNEENEISETREILRKISNANLIIDKLDLSESYVKSFKNLCRKIVTFDNKGLGALYADLNIYPLYSLPKEFENKNNFYSGPEFVILKDSFYSSKSRGKISKNARKIIISLGGTDPTKTTLKVIRSLNGLNNINVDVVIGSGFTFKNQILDEIKNLRNFRIIENSRDLSKILRKSDIAILSGGITPYEAAFLGTPSIVICHNRGEMEHSFKDYGFCINLGLTNNVSEKMIKKEVESLIHNYEKRKELSFLGMSLFPAKPKNLIIDLLLNSQEKNGKFN